MLPNLGFFYIWILESELKFSSLQAKCLLTELSWGPHSTAFASVENQVKMVAEVLSPPAASSNLCTHPRRCAHATDYQNHLNALFLRHRDWELNSQLNWGLASYLILLDSSSSRQFTANIRFLTLTCWQDTCQSLLPCLVHLLPFTSALEHIYLEQIKLS